MSQACTLVIATTIFFCKRRLDRAADGARIDCFDDEALEIAAAGGAHDLIQLLGIVEMRIVVLRDAPYFAAVSFAALMPVS